jgi:hypothetical protein
VIGLYQEPGLETVTALFLPVTTDSLFLRLRPSHGHAEITGVTSHCYFQLAVYHPPAISPLPALVLSLAGARRASPT